MENLTEMLRGVLEGCVLEIISREQNYGYEITKKINEMGFKDVVEGTIYTILVRLEKNGLVTVEKKPSEFGPQRKFYKLNDNGIAQHELFWEKWNYISEKINQMKEK
ncbi:MAG: PadR family transcriptional regulator [Herbinix sp.]|nr:PadR family transcriptional regulator [Herbinix sp.]